MYYSYQDGAQRRLIDRFGDFTNILESKNLLPVGVATVMVLWVALIVAGFQQGNPFTPVIAGEDASIQPNTGQVINVENSSSNIRDTGGPMVSVASPGDSMVLSTAQTAVAADTSDVATEILGDDVGGRGADEPTNNTDNPVDVPETPSTPVVTLPDTPITTPGDDGSTNIDLPPLPTDPLIQLPTIQLPPITINPAGLL